MAEQGVLHGFGGMTRQLLSAPPFSSPIPTFPRQGGRSVVLPLEPFPADPRPYSEKGIFTRLQNVALFKQAYVALDPVCWPGDLDIAPETLFDRSTPLQAD